MRVTVFWPDGDDVPAVLVTVRPPAEVPAAAQGLMSARYQRPVPHIKHIGGFGQTYYNRLAASRGSTVRCWSRRTGSLPRDPSPTSRSSMKKP